MQHGKAYNTIHLGSALAYAPVGHPRRAGAPDCPPVVIKVGVGDYRAVLGVEFDPERAEVVLTISEESHAPGELDIITDRDIRGDSSVPPPPDSDYWN